MTIIKILVFLLLFAFSKGLYTPEQGYDKQISYQVQYISQKFKISIENAKEIVENISEVAKLRGIKPSLIYAIVEKESSFNINASNDNGRANCLMQVHTSSGYILLENSPLHCLITGTQILVDFYARTANMNSSLAMYFCGRNIQRKDCKDYVTKVRYLQEKYKGWV